MSLTANELEIMRADLEELLPDTCQIISLTLTPDGSGGVTSTEGTVTASCRKDTKTGNFVTLDGKVETGRKEMITLPYDTAIAENDLIVHDSVRYNVVFITDGSWMVSKRVEVKKQ